MEETKMKKIFMILALVFISINIFSEELYFKNCKEAREKGYKLKKDYFLIEIVLFLLKIYLTKCK